jgi:hypothetical protein
MMQRNYRRLGNGSRRRNDNISNDNISPRQRIVKGLTTGFNIAELCERTKTINATARNSTRQTVMDTEQGE